MKPLKIACTIGFHGLFLNGRSIELIDETDFLPKWQRRYDRPGYEVIDTVHNTEFGIPLFIILRNRKDIDPEVAKKVNMVFDCGPPE
jgi:ornithine decarboxylase